MYQTSEWHVAYVMPRINKTQEPMPAVYLVRGILQLARVSANGGFESLGPGVLFH